MFIQIIAVPVFVGETGQALRKFFVVGSKLAKLSAVFRFGKREKL